LKKAGSKPPNNYIADGLMVINRNMEIVLHNPALMTLLEISEHIENPASIPKFINDSDLLATLNNIQYNLSSDRTFVSQKIRMYKKTLRAISAVRKSA